MDFVDLKSQYKRLKPSIDENIANVLAHGQYVMGPEIAQLEKELADFVNVSDCVSVSSGTDALVIALLASGVGPGDEVITSPFSFFASAESIALLGAIPVFVDIETETYNLDANLLEAAISNKTKVIMPVSLYGQCAEFTEINAIAMRHNIVVIEDGAQSFGASYRDRRSGSLSTIGCTSFFPSKPLGCYGDGGACFTGDPALAKKMREIRDHGQKSRYAHHSIGLNGRLDTLQAAVLLAKLKVFEDEILARQAVASRYNEYLAEHGDRVGLPVVRKYNTSVFAQYTIMLAHRDKVQEILKSKGIPTAVHYPVPLHRQPALEEYGCIHGELRNSEQVAQKVLSLPMHPYLRDEEQSEICHNLLLAIG